MPLEGKAGWELAAILQSNSPQKRASSGHQLFKCLEHVPFGL